MEVSSYYVEPAATLLDPMVPDGGMAAFEGLARPEKVALTCRHHNRDHEQFVEMFGCTVHVSEAGIHEFEGSDVRSYAVGDTLAPGVVVRAGMPIAPDDMALHIDIDSGVLAFADSLIREGGELGVVPDKLLGDDPEQVRRDIQAAVQDLLSERFDHLLFAHGDPLIGGGHAALEEFVGC